MTDAEWAIVAPLCPDRTLEDGADAEIGARCSMRSSMCCEQAARSAFRRTASYRDTVYRWFGELRDTGGFEDLNHHLVQLDRIRAGREPMPSAAVIDSQSVKTNEAGGPTGYDAGKRIKGRKRHAMVDTDGRALELLVQPADVQDRDGAVPLLKMSRGRHPFVRLAYADSAYASSRLAMVTSIDIEIVRKFADQTGFVVQPRRRVVERTFAWLNRNRSSLTTSSKASERQPFSMLPQQ